MAQQQQRSASKGGYRKSTNDLFETTSENNRFRTMYSAAFVDHSKRESRDKTHHTMMSPIARPVHMVSGKITTPLKQ